MRKDDDDHMNDYVHSENKGHGDDVDDYMHVDDDIRDVDDNDRDVDLKFDDLEPEDGLCGQEQQTGGADYAKQLCC